MPSRRTIFRLAATMLAAATLPGRAAESHIAGATSITEVFSDGQKLTAVAIEYDREIDGKESFRRLSRWTGGQLPARMPALARSLARARSVGSS